MRDIETDVRSQHLTEVPPLDAVRTCGICGGTARRVGTPSYFKWRGKRTVDALWTCDNCSTTGNEIRDPESGAVLRMSHVMTGNGFEVAGEDEFSVDPEGWRVNESDSSHG